jgi:hypothetical protein
VRDLADVVIICVKAVEGVVDVLARTTAAPLTASPGWDAYDSGDPYDEEGIDVEEGLDDERL